MPTRPSPVFEIAMTGVWALWATGWAATAVFESVGPRMATTRSWPTCLRKAVTPPSVVDWSSSMTSTSFAPFTPPASLMRWAASSTPFFCVGP